MKKGMFLLLSVLAISNTLFAQKASDILENGIIIDSKSRLFLKYCENNAIKYYITDKDNIDKTYFCDLKDSTIFVSKDNEIHIFLMPLNPLKFTYNQNISYINDPIDSSAIAAYNMIYDFFNMINSPIKKNNKKETTDFFKKEIMDSSKKETMDSIKKEIMDSIKKIKDSLKDDQNKKIVLCFKNLKKLSFNDEKNTKDSLKIIRKKINNIENHFSSIDSLINNSTNKILKNGTNLSLIEIYVLNEILNNLKEIAGKQKKRLNNLLNAYIVVEKFQVKATKGGDGFKWLVELKPFKRKEGKIFVNSISIRKSIYKLMQNEIILSKGDIVYKNTFKIRKFQRFVPEVSVGFAFTNIDYYTYGTTIDSTGQQYIAPPSKNKANNINITAMINFNYFISNSFIHPFYQIGAGFKNNFPIFLTGIGLRSNINGIRRIAISGGLAMTWVQELNKLKVGDFINGTDDINKDLIYKFSWPPKFYIGIQYNF